MRKLLLILLFTGLLFGALFCAPALADTALSRGLDTSLRPSLRQYQAMHRAGYSFVGRYLFIPGGGKKYSVTRAELLNAKTAGVDVFLIFEWCSPARSLLPDDYTRGRKDGALAARALKSLVLPASTVVYFSLDRAPRSTTGALAYFQGVQTALGSSRYVGCYGSKAQLLALERAGLISYTWHARWMDNNPMPLDESMWDMYQSTRLVYPGDVPCDQVWKP